MNLYFQLLVFLQIHFAYEGDILLIVHVKLNFKVLRPNHGIITVKYFKVEVTKYCEINHLIVKKFQAKVWNSFKQLQIKFVISDIQLSSALFNLIWYFKFVAR